ncbi:acyl-CoA dehydrogenase [Nocardioides nematodiphilus]|uniref:acyl-CoA dehydrogenase n=1 Tax=Nocardioides nematodiphilus TaxID=2849669 RepID=UPI001CD966AD|nr:acyl-CoA dehydrogenase [Nocardioides nematodiphilus]MCA1982139.1 acyl-CoA dehydrogenase [Nocardioides nematodiphilus]
MPIGVSDEHRDLTTSMRGWAEGLGGPALARAAEGQAAEVFDAVWGKVVDQGVVGICVPEALGGGGGSVLDAAVALEVCAAALVPGALLGTTVVGALLARHGSALPDSARAGFALGPDVAYDAVGAELLLLPREGAWWLVPADEAAIAAVEGLDLTRRAARVSWTGPVDAATRIDGLAEEDVRRMALTFAAAECAGVVSWCLATAVDHAKVREQFGAPIGSFQAIKHLCAGMLETSEAVAAAAWDVASAADAGDDEQWAYAADVAGAICLDGAVQVAQDCIQVLGGIGFTFEHDAHLALRRAITLRALLGAGDGFALSLAGRAVSGARRRVRVRVEDGHGEDRDAAIRTEVREQVAAIAAADDRRAALVDSGYLTPHWSAPYGIDATPVQQLVIDEELAAAGVERPDLKIAGWAVSTILQHGTDAQRERFVRPSLLGEINWCQLFSEPGAGSDLASLTTRAERVDGGWRLTGQKVWTSLAREADWAICLARTDPTERRHRGITYFLVDMRLPGLDVRPLREITGDAMFNEVFLDGVVVPDECVVGDVHGGWRLARTSLANERVAMASARLGVSVERCVELVGDSPVDRVRVGHQVALATVCASLGARVTLRALTGSGPGPESSVAKLLGVRSRQEASELAVTLAGHEPLLSGADSSADLHEMLLTRCLSIAGGTTQLLRNVAAEQILGLPR